MILIKSVLEILFPYMYVQGSGLHAYVCAYVYGRFIYVDNVTNLAKMEFASIQDNQLVFAEEENGATIYRGIH